MNYYVFFCLDGVPIFETILDKNKKAIENLEEIDWYQTKYVVLDFKSVLPKNQKAVAKGKIKSKQKVLTKQIIYYQINISESQKILQNKPIQINKIDKLLLEMAIVLFLGTPNEFLNYVKKKKIMRSKEIKKLEKALLNQKKEQEILDTWKNIKTS